MMTSPAYGSVDPPRLASGSPGFPGGSWRRRLARVAASILAIAFVVAVAVDLTRDVFLASVEEMGGPAVLPDEQPNLATTAASTDLERDPRATRGAAVFAEQGCNACHAVDGSVKIGPSLGGLWGTDQELADGSLVRVTEDYVYESILDPQAKVVRGFESAAMPSYDGLIDEQDLAALVAYLRSLP
jgi:mono/diheme cytochrome c family protein